jgi:hypothetical protein
MTRRQWLMAAAAPTICAQEVEKGFQPVSGWTIVDGPESAYIVTGDEISVSPFASFPTWLRSGREYENFELRGEFFIKGWTDSGLYLNAPEHGRPTWAGMQIKIFHQNEKTPTPQSVGAVLPVIAPLAISVREGWNDLRVWMEWPRLRVWINGVLVQDLNRETEPALRHRLRQGYLGIAAASAACRFRRLRVRELPGQESWRLLYGAPGDLDANWQVSEGKPEIFSAGPVLRLDGLGHLATKEKFRDFEFQAYVRAAPQHNGGILFRSSGRGQPNPRHYEVQLHNVEEAHFPTGSLYHYQRAVYPRIEDEKWYFFQLRVDGPECMVRINGDTVMTYSKLENLEPGFIELQAHRRGYWTEFKRIRVKPLG